MIDKRVLEIRKRAYGEIVASVKAGGSSGTRFTSLVFMVSQHGLTSRFVADFVDVMEGEGVVRVERDARGKPLVLYYE